MGDIPADLSYEEAFAQLEEILAALESGDLSLDETLVKYEAGAALAAFCERKLEEAELRVRQWQPDDAPTPFDEWSNE